MDVTDHSDDASRGNGKDIGNQRKGEPQNWEEFDWVYNSLLCVQWLKLTQSAVVGQAVLV